MPWPPSDEDVAYKAWLIDQFIEHGYLRMDQRNWSDVRGERFYGEYHFGLRMGLKGHCGVFEKNKPYDYLTEIGKIDVKAIIDSSHRLMRGVRDSNPSDIYVLALINPMALSLKNVLLLGWCYNSELILAPIVTYRAPAYALYSNQLREIPELERLLGVNGRGVFENLAVTLPLLSKPEHHWIPKKHQGQQPLF